jgi:hypothetical protein
MEPKTTCKFCGCVILQATANRTNGYCAPHTFYGLPYLERIKCKINHYEIVNPQNLDFTEIPENKREALTSLISEMKEGDKLCRFTSLPENDWTQYYIELGYAILRDTIWIDGVDIIKKSNEYYYKAKVNFLHFEEFLRYHPEEYWDDLLARHKPGDQFIYVFSSPYSWHHLWGREEIVIIRDEKIVYRRHLLVS